MKRKQYLFLVILTITAGLIGGAISSPLFTLEVAIAQDSDSVRGIPSDNWRDELIEGLKKNSTVSLPGV